MTRAPDHLAAALEYVARGHAVFPLKPGTKDPDTRRGFKDATALPATVETWWRRSPDAGIGCATGAVSGFWSLDVDVDKDGESTIRSLEARHGPLPQTVELLTGGGGRQLFFQHETGISCTVQRIGPGVDTRGDGGYTILPPSIHPSGRRYEWSVDGHPNETCLARAPVWLVQLLRSSATKQATPAGEWRRLVEGQIAEGQRNASLARLSGHLLRHYVDAYVTLALMRAWNSRHCDPPLCDEEVVRTVNSIARREKERREGKAA